MLGGAMYGGVDPVTGRWLKSPQNFEEERRRVARRRRMRALTLIPAVLSSCAVLWWVAITALMDLHARHFPGEGLHLGAEGFAPAVASAAALIAVFPVALLIGKQFAWSFSERRTVKGGEGDDRAERFRRGKFRLLIITAVVVPIASAVAIFASLVSWGPR
ncbi:MAG TPA: hypothetical protein VJ992_15800 [Gemmatimonadales bacterium]|nr:hypothetical protein [Gemmatimonadales bacterium]